MTCMTHHSHSIYRIYDHMYVIYSPSWILSSYHWNNYTLNHFTSRKMLGLRPSNLDQCRTMVQCIHIVLLQLHKSACQLASRNLSSMCKDSGKHQDMPREWPLLHIYEGTSRRTAKQILNEVRYPSIANRHGETEDSTSTAWFSASRRHSTDSRRKNWGPHFEARAKWPSCAKFHTLQESWSNFFCIAGR